MVIIDAQQTTNDLLNETCQRHILELNQRLNSVELYQKQQSSLLHLVIKEQGGLLSRIQEDLRKLLGQREFRGEDYLN